jgi:hypothetical protein
MNNSMKQDWLPFWDFFHSIEKELSYERWIDKYFLLLKAFERDYFSFNDDWSDFKNFCRAVYLQNYHDIESFNALLNKAIEREKELMLAYVKNVSLSYNSEDETLTQEAILPGNEEESITSIPPLPDLPEDAPGLSEDVAEEPSDHDGPMSFQYNPPAMEPVKNTTTGNTKNTSEEFLMTDEYFPVTRRQMVKGWQFLRYKEKGGFTTEIDIAGTVKKIAKSGMFLEPQFKYGLRNREDTLIIFADCNGSMTPFHELTDRLIETARTEGGHPRAPVYYFQNYPTGYVYRKQNFSEPLKIKEALVKSNRNSTVAIVISDAGAARGNTDPKRKKERKDMTLVLLKSLRESCAHTVWLNPMPVHRWKNTAAELISRDVNLMSPIIDHYTNNFQDTLRTILRRTKES